MEHDINTLSQHAWTMKHRTSQSNLYPNQAFMRAFGDSSVGLPVKRRSLGCPHSLMEGECVTNVDEQQSASKLHHQ